MQGVPGRLAAVFWEIHAMPCRWACQIRALCLAGDGMEDWNTLQEDAHKPWWCKPASAGSSFSPCQWSWHMPGGIITIPLKHLSSYLPMFGKRCSSWAKLLGAQHGEGKVLFCWCHLAEDAVTFLSLQMVTHDAYSLWLKGGRDQVWAKHLVPALHADKVPERLCKPHQKMRMCLRGHTHSKLSVKWILSDE